jgi:hypothetical protein
VNVLVELFEPMGADVVVSPGKDAVSVYELEGSDAVMSQVAVPVESVFAVHVSEPFSVKVTGSLTMGVPVLGLVSTALTGVGVEKVPVTGWTVNVDGTVVVTGGGAATSISLSTDRPKRNSEWVSIVCSTAPLAMSTR